MSLGGSSSSSRQSSESSGYGFGASQSNTFLDPRQQHNQQGLVGRFNNQFGQLGRTPGLEGNRRDTMQGLRQAGNQLAGFGGQLRNQSKYGANALRQFSKQNNPYLKQQISGLQQDFGQMFNEQILPGIGSNAQMAGQRGSSRQGIAEGLAAQRTMQEFGQAATGLRAGAYQQQQQAATALMGQGQLANQAFAGSAQAAAQQGQLANQFGQTSLQASAQPFQIGSQVIGAPSVLSQSQAFDVRQQNSKSSGKSSSSSLNVGF